MTPSKEELGVYRRYFTIGLRELKEISEQRDIQEHGWRGSEQGFTALIGVTCTIETVILAGFEVSLKVRVGQKSDLKVVPEES